ncbi:DUF6176 family protein [uncultured Rothia sp.]|uniref:DUF6176 family protein n=1 Tax=uncultured Rothia sp. TaxID=316088 RepID=UPI00321752CB
MKIELVRFRVKPGKDALVDEWINFLNNNMDAVKETLEPELMYVETIFSESMNGKNYLYWYSVQGESDARQEVHNSEHWLDKKHLFYWNECIDPDFKPEFLTPRVMMMPDRVKSSMQPVD